MSFQELGSLGEFIAAVATVTTLVYLALQVRMNNRLAVSNICLLYTSPSPRDTERSRMPSSA